MTNRKLKQEAQRAVTARFPLSDYAEIMREAEERGTTIADMLRLSWNSYLQQKELKYLLTSMESRLVRKVFEISSATVGLDESERKDAMQEFKERIAGGKENVQ